MYSPVARRAMTSETRGQNSWVNTNKNLRKPDGTLYQKGEEGYVEPPDRPFAEQKSGLLPQEFVELEAPPQFAAAPRERRAEDPRGLNKLAQTVAGAMTKEELAEDIRSLESGEPLFAAAPPRNSPEARRIFKDAYVRDSIFHSTPEPKLFWEFLTRSELGAHFGHREAALGRMDATNPLVQYVDEYVHGRRVSDRFSKDKYMRMYKVRLAIKKPLITMDAVQWSESEKIIEALQEAEENPINNLPDGLNWGVHGNAEGFLD